MNDELDKSRVQADNQSIAIGEINIGGNVTGNIHIGHTIIQAADARLRHDLGILLKNVETTWIKGVLEKSVHESALLELGMEIRAEAVDNPWRMVMEKPDQSQEVIPQGRKIKDIFDEANRLLLILGEPGSGKTTTLLQLARDLIAEVGEAFTQPIPVILNLSTWIDKQQPLDEWLIAELNSKYRLPKKDGKLWLSEHRILPLLDGLDEVRAENRSACVEKINHLVTDYGLQGLVVCSRIKDYTDLNVCLAFYRAIYIQQLTPEQVDEYLNQAGDKLTSLRATLQADDALRSMAQSPLILNIMSLAYQNASAQDLSNPALNTNKARRKHLFDAYIARMFNRKAGRQEYDTEQTKQRLSWLARNMERHNQQVFLIEGLQPSWLLIRRWQWIYIIVSRLGFGLILGLICEKLISVFGDANEEMIFGLMGGITGLTVGVIDVLRYEWFSKKGQMKKFLSFWRSLINFVVIWFASWLVFWLYFDDPIFGSIFGLSIGLILGLRGAQQSPDKDIQTYDALHWSWNKLPTGGLTGIRIGVLTAVLIENTVVSFPQTMLGLNGELITYYTPPSLFERIAHTGLYLGLLGGLIGAIFTGLNRKIIETKSIPNQGIQLLTRSAIIGGLISGLVVGLFTGVDNDIRYGIYQGLYFGLITGLIGSLWFGGLDIIKHYILRLILIFHGHTPKNYAHFLDNAVDHIFLQKVGGGYRFIHRLLLEHFADMYEKKS